LPSKTKRAQRFEDEARQQLETFRRIRRALGAEPVVRPLVFPCKGVAEFVGFKTRPNEMALNFGSLTTIVELLQATPYKFHARFHVGGGAVSSFRDGRPIYGNLDQVKAELALRFESQVTPWSWTNKSGRPCQEPSKAR
jgi:hypothetical protein